MMSALFALAVLAGFAVALALLFMPTLVARSRNHPNVLAIFLVNLFFGWTFVGWIVSLIWACTRPAMPVLYAPVYAAVLPPPHLSTGRRPAAVFLPPAPYQGPR